MRRFSVVIAFVFGGFLLAAAMFQIAGLAHYYEADFFPPR